jgi:hypothetical protein
VRRLAQPHSATSALSLRLSERRAFASVMASSAAPQDRFLSFMLFNRADAVRDLLVCGILWRLFDWTRRGHPGDDRALHRLHLFGHRLAGALPARDERAQQQANTKAIDRC